jgi:hypothetical protein
MEEVALFSVKHKIMTEQKLKIRQSGNHAPFVRKSRQIFAARLRV